MTTFVSSTFLHQKMNGKCSNPLHVRVLVYFPLHVDSLWTLTTEVNKHYFSVRSGWETSFVLSFVQTLHRLQFLGSVLHKSTFTVRTNNILGCVGPVKDKVTQQLDRIVDIFSEFFQFSFKLKLVCVEITDANFIRYCFQFLIFFQINAGVSATHPFSQLSELQLPQLFLVHFPSLHPPTVSKMVIAQMKVSFGTATCKHLPSCFLSFGGTHTKSWCSVTPSPRPPSKPRGPFSTILAQATSVRTQC